ncbi:MAG: superoxide dismutase family protein [Sneathiellaceae bacterium]
MPGSKCAGTVLQIAVLGFALTAAVAQAQAEDPKAVSANMINTSGDLVAKVSLERVAQGTHVVLSGNGLPPGIHAFHIHETGTCDPADGFKSAGGHFNPGGTQHGWNNPAGHHAGDLPNVHVGENGVAAVEVFMAVDVLAAGTGNLLDADGAAMVMHQGADDYASDPAGAAGDRIACGVIKAGGG